MLRYGLITLALAALTVEPVYGQSLIRQGTITYDLAVDVRRQMAKENRAMALLVPKQMHMNVSLSFSDAVYAVTMAGNLTVMGVNFPMPGVDEKLIVNLKAPSQRTERSYSGHNYYTEIAVKSPPVISYGTQTKVILGYTCHFATITTSDKTRYNVWYTTAIPYAYSPDGLDFAGLKGAVLEYGNDEQLFKAVAISAAGFNQASINADATAKKITEEQMDNLREEAADEAIKKALAARKKKK